MRLCPPSPPSRAAARCAPHCPSRPTAGDLPVRDALLRCFRRRGSATVARPSGPPGGMFVGVVGEERLLGVSSTVRSGWTPRVARAPAMHYVPAGPGLPACSSGRAAGTGSGRVQPSVTGIHPRAGLRALSPRPGFTRSRVGCIFTLRCVGAPLMQSRRRTQGFRRGLFRGPGRAARLSGDAPHPCLLARRSRAPKPGLATRNRGNRDRRTASRGTAALPAGRSLKLDRRAARCRAADSRSRASPFARRARSHGLLGNRSPFLAFRPPRRHSMRPCPRPSTNVNPPLAVSSPPATLPLRRRHPLRRRTAVASSVEDPRCSED